MKAGTLEIRHANSSDLESIIGLLKLSLGESLMPKSPQFWKWKHIDNPFGESPVLLAFDGGRLVGVRAFMRWQWKASGRVITAVRAVDTATHPEYQGRGIFTSLTTRLIKQCEDEGVGFIFNTPNKKSKPGYLKMGWESIGRLEVFCAPNFFRGKEQVMASGSATTAGETLVRQLIGKFPHDNSIRTNYTYNYLKWRYDENPNVKYQSLMGDKGEWLLIFRVKPLIMGSELRVVDFFADNSREALSAARDSIRKAGKGLVTMASHSLPGFIGLRMGPEVTVRRLAISQSLDFHNWSPSLGDLELF